MAVPKHRRSKAKTKIRRNTHDKVAKPTYQRCPECFAAKRPHRACLECGFYKGEQVIEIWEY